MNFTSTIRLTLFLLLLFMAFVGGVIMYSALGVPTTANAAAAVPAPVQPSGIPAELGKKGASVRILFAAGGTPEGNIIDAYGSWVKFKYKEDGLERWINTDAINAQWEVK
jgi:hypothetical protein